MAERAFHQSLSSHLTSEKTTVAQDSEVKNPLAPGGPSEAAIQFPLAQFMR
jgi:hypothetical protein